jgi:hypothetical protein
LNEAQSFLTLAASLDTMLAGYQWCWRIRTSASSPATCSPLSPPTPRNKVYFTCSPTVLHAAGDLAAGLTPSPIDGAILALPRLGGWQTLSGTTTGRLESLAPWAARHLGHLTTLEQQAGLVLGGATLLHGDLYPFNVMLDQHHLWFVDWPHAWIGAPYRDVLTLLSTASLRGIDPRPIADTHPLTRRLDADEINTFLAVHSGFLIRLAATAEPAADPAMVDTALQLGRASLPWLKHRLDHRR